MDLPFGYEFEGSKWHFAGLVYLILFGVFGIWLGWYALCHSDFENSSLGTACLIVLIANGIGFFVGLLAYVVYNFVKLCELWFK